MTSCTSYRVTSDAPVFFDPNPAKYEKALAERREHINKLKINRDKSWYRDEENYEGWAVYTQDGVRHIGLCKEQLVTAVGNPISFQCDGNSEFPLQALLCKADKKSRWYLTCATRGKPNNDIRLYWVDTGENEDGSPLEINSGYNKDLVKFRSKCSAKK